LAQPHGAAIWIADMYYLLAILALIVGMIADQTQFNGYYMNKAAYGLSSIIR
jgi:hypothetical protein